MTKDRFEKESKKFTGKDDCYIHIEHKGHENGFEVMTTGGMYACLVGVCAIIRNIAFNSHIPTSEALEFIEKVIEDVEGRSKLN